MLIVALHLSTRKHIFQLIGAKFGSLLLLIYKKVVK